MTYTIVTGPHPSHPGACVAQYNHFLPNHSPNHNPNHHYNSHQNQQHIMPYIQQPITPYGYYGHPYWKQPGTSFPNFY